MLCCNLNSPIASLQMYLVHCNLIEQKYGCRQQSGLLFTCMVEKGSNLMVEDNLLSIAINKQTWLQCAKWK